MTDDPSWLSSFSDAGSAAAGASDGLSSGVLAGGEIGAGALAGTGADALSGIGSIAPQAAATGALGADLIGSGLSLGESAGGGGVPLGISAGGAGGAGAGTAPIGSVPFSNAPVSGIAATPATGALGSAAAGAAPAATPEDATTSGLFRFSGDGGDARLSDPTAGPGVVGKLGDATSAVPTGTPTPGTPPVPTSAWDKFKAAPGLGTGFDALTSNPNLVLAGLGLGANLALGDRKLPGESQLGDTAGRLGAQAEALQNYLGSGTLPPGVHAGLSSAGAAAKATIKSRHASSGTSGSSAEQQELASVDNQITTQGANIAMSLFQQGLQESQISSQLYQTILQGALSQDQELGSAIGRFASTLAGGPTINLGRTV